MNAEVRAGDEPGRPTRRRVLWFASFVLGAALFLLVLAATAADADVDASGSFSTNVPLTSPAFHGIEPRLSLNYSSAGVEGWLGDGWTIQGLSAITRESNDHGLPRWDDSTDGYSLDGEPLVSCGPPTACPPPRS